jgi:hypothetical protein
VSATGDRYDQIQARHRKMVKEKARLWAAYELAEEDRDRASEANDLATDRSRAAFAAWDALCRRHEAEDSEILAALESARGPVSS